MITQTGYAGAKVPLVVEDDGRIVSTQEVTLPARRRVDDRPRDVHGHTTPARGSSASRSRRSPSEQVTQNNARDALVEVSDRREKMLYMEGEPRFEAKFIRRAVEDDENLQVVILQRTAEDKYLRLDVGSPDELVGGFPKTREELFAYRAVILGSVEAASFTPDQLRMLADFVEQARRRPADAGRPPFVRRRRLGRHAGRRGAAGGPRCAADRATTPYFIAAVGEADARRRRRSRSRSCRRSTEGRRLAVGRLAGASASVNPVRTVKPGATVLLTGADEKKQEQVVLAYQRYGRGKALALPIQDSWIWKMDATIAVDDTTHATFWRRLVRWLVDGVPDPVSVTTTTDRVEPGEPMKLTAEVVDPAFVEVNDAKVVAQVTTPSGKIVDVPMEWSVTQGRRVPRARSCPTSRGATRSAPLRRGRRATSAPSVLHARASAGDAEYFDAAMRSTLLKRVAEDTGGRFFTPANAATLPEAISYSGRGVTVVEERDLWDMPILLLVLLALVGAEWGYRRARGLA